MSTFCGLSNEGKTSSRVLKPPGGGHSDIFGSPEIKPNHARPKYDQQNSSNISGALGTADANQLCEQTARTIEEQHPMESVHQSDPVADTNGSMKSHTNGDANLNQSPVQTGRGRVPPGGYSTGFW